MTTSRSDRPILVTGASTGIGRALVERLADLGHPVFAAARKPADLEELAALPDVTPLRLDVRSGADVEAALARVRAAGRGLYGLVNNAGLGGIGPLVSYTDEELRDLFEVNVFGVIRVTRAFLPLLLESRGRIVLVGSQAGSISMKYYGPYSMTKHALEAMTVALDAEVRPHGVRVSIFQPGAVATAIGDNSSTADRDRFSRAPAPFDTEARALLESDEAGPTYDPALPEGPGNRNPATAGEAADVVRLLLEADDPPLRVLFGTRWEGNRVLTALAEKLVDANACPSLGESREDLAARLDRALADLAAGRRGMLPDAPPRTR
jgi:NAD(P)-dependent dehydrogenase (short-subunit alcohol dehydrogenase family)